MHDLLRSEKIYGISINNLIPLVSMFSDCSCLVEKYMAAHKLIDFIGKIVQKEIDLMRGDYMVLYQWGAYSGSEKIINLDKQNSFIYK